MLKKILIGVGAVVALFLVILATRPSTFHVERATVIATTPDVVFAQVNDLRSWGAWSPWEKLDPAMQKTFAGPEAGVGQSNSWSGNDKAGKGKMTIVESVANERVNVSLEFLEPWSSTATSGLTFKPAEGGTQVTWWMNGDVDFVGRAFHMFMDMDAMIGGEYDKGLASLKELSETKAREAAAVAAAAQAAAEAQAQAAAAVPAKKKK
jgi:hypothetical protein